MPAIATHYLFGKEVYKNLIKKNRKDILALLRKYRKDFNIGLQGPDPFFYYRPTLKDNEIGRYAHDIHSNSGLDFFSHACEEIQKSKSLRMFAYTLGVVCHYALDSEAHPTVNRLGKDSVGHIQIETELDREMLLREIMAKDAKMLAEKERVSIFEKLKERFGAKRKYALAIFNPKTKKAYRPSILPERIKRFQFVKYEKGLPEIIAPLYPKATKKQVEEALNSCIKYNKMLYSPTGTNIAVIRKLESIVRKKGIFSSLAMTGKRFESHVENARKIIPIYERSIEIGTNLLISMFDAVRYHSKLSTRFEKVFG